MAELLLDLGDERFALLIVALGWAAAVLLYCGLLLFRRRPPSLLLWCGPGATLLVVSATSWWTQQGIDARLTLAGVQGAERAAASLTALRVALTPLMAGLYVVAIGCTITAVCVAMANVARTGPKGRLTLLHAGGALPALAAAPFGLMAGLDVFTVAVVNAAALAVSSTRMGIGADARRMAAARALVAALGVASLLALTLTLPLGYRLAALRIWVEQPHADQPAALAALGSPFDAIVSSLGVAAVFVVCGFIVLLPVARYVVNARAGAGFVMAFLGMAATAASLALPLHPLTQLRQPNPMLDRRIALEAAGIVLPVKAKTHSWVAGTHAMVGLYWATVEGERLIPFQEGRVSGALDEDALDNALRQGVGNPLVVEADYRADLPRLSPLLQAAQAIGTKQVCFVVQDEQGQMACQSVRLGKATEAEHHLLVQPDELVYIQETPRVVRLEELSSLPGPLAVHPHPNLTGDRLFTVLAEGLNDPMLVLSR